MIKKQTEEYNEKTVPLLLALCMVLCLLPAASFAQELNTNGYVVLVNDERGTPVAGAMVQFCSETACMFAKTDKTGLARFETEPGSYTVHIMKVPAGYLPDSTEYPVPETWDLITITLKTEGQEEDAPDAEEPAVIDNPLAGFRFVLPDTFQNLKGDLEWSGSYLKNDILEIAATYYAVRPEQFGAYCDYGEAYIDAVMEDKELTESPDPSWLSGNEYAFIFQVYFMGKGQGEVELRQFMIDSGFWREDNFSSLEELGREGDTTFCFAQYAQLQEEDDDYRAVMGDFYDEFARMRDDKEAILSGLTLSEPKWPVVIEPSDIIFLRRRIWQATPSQVQRFSPGRKSPW